MARGGLLAGYVLHQRPFRERSQLVELFTAEEGRCGVVARRSRRQPLQLFQPLTFRLSGRGELLRLQHWEERGPGRWLEGDSLVCGLYLNELLYRLLHRGLAQPELFVAYEAALTALAALSGGTVDRGEPEPAQRKLLERVLRQFELLLLEVLGYAVDIAADAEGAVLEADRRYRFVAGRGLVAAVDGPLSGRGLIDHAQGRWTEAAQRDLKGLCRQALAPHLGDRPLLSRRLFPRRPGAVGGEGRTDKETTER